MIIGEKLGSGYYIFWQREPLHPLFVSITLLLVYPIMKIIRKKYMIREIVPKAPIETFQCSFTM